MAGILLDAGRSGAFFFQDKVEMADFSLDAGRKAAFFFQDKEGTTGFLQDGGRNGAFFPTQEWNGRFFTRCWQKRNVFLPKTRME